MASYKERVISCHICKCMELKDSRQGSHRKTSTVCAVCSLCYVGTKKVDLTWKGGGWIGKGGMHMISVCHVMYGKIIEPQEYVPLIYTNKWMLERQLRW